MTRKTYIEALLQSAFHPTLLEVIDESAHHHGHAGVPAGAQETHFRIRMRASCFEGLSLLQRHHKVNMLLKPLFNEGLHALTLELSLPSQL